MNKAFAFYKLSHMADDILLNKKFVLCKSLLSALLHFLASTQFYTKSIFHFVLNPKGDYVTLLS